MSHPKWDIHLVYPPFGLVKSEWIIDPKGPYKVAWVAIIWLSQTSTTENSQMAQVQVQLNYRHSFKLKSRQLKKYLPVPSPMMAVSSPIACHRLLPTSWRDRDKMDWPVVYPLKCQLCPSWAWSTALPLSCPVPIPHESHCWLKYHLAIQHNPTPPATPLLTLDPTYPIHCKPAHLMAWPDLVCPCQHITILFCSIHMSHITPDFWKPLQ
jgi:hypothetical protein